jgi:excinuclease ABC subunit C
VIARRRRGRSANEEVERRVALLREHVEREAQDRPAVYRFIAADGEILYVGKAKRLRTRLLAYFRAAYPRDKSARTIRDARSIAWDYVPNEFAALLHELRLIKQWRPRHNVMLKWDARHYAFVRIAQSAAPRFQVVRGAGSDVTGVYYGPFHGAVQLTEAVRALNDALGLRDCRADMPMFFADQTELPVGMPRTPRCIRHEIGTCLGPCCGRTTHDAYGAQFALARAFIEGTQDAPLASLRNAMTMSSERLEFERAAVLRDRLARLESLREQLASLRYSVESLSFVYIVPGVFNNDRAYVVRRGCVRADLPAPRTRAERSALAEHARHLLEEPPRGGAQIPAHEVDELMLVSSWFRKYPHEFARTSALDQVGRRSARPRNEVKSLHIG